MGLYLAIPFYLTALAILLLGAARWGNSNWVVPYALFSALTSFGLSGVATCGYWSLSASGDLRSFLQALSMIGTLATLVFGALSLWIGRGVGRRHQLTTRAFLWILALSPGIGFAVLLLAFPL